MSIEHLKHLIAAVGAILVPATSAWAGSEYAQATTREPAQGADETALPSATKTTIFETDLVGRWKHGAGSELSWVTSSGAYAGSQSVLYSESWELHPDMTYDYRFDGTSSVMGQVHQQRAGMWALSGSKIVFSPEGDAKEEGYWFLSFDDYPNGSVLRVLPDRYEPEEGNLFYKQEWVRAKKE